jgi:hypothetical protein
MSFYGHFICDKCLLYVVPTPIDYPCHGPAQNGRIGVEQELNNSTDKPTLQYLYRTDQVFTATSYGFIYQATNDNHACYDVTIQIKEEAI